MDDFLPERQASGQPDTKASVRHPKFTFLLAAVLCAALIAVGCGPGSAPMADSEDDTAVSETAAAEPEEADTASREPAAEEASAEDAEPAESTEVAEAEPEPASDPEPVPDEAVVEAPDWTTHAFVDGGYYVLGNPEAEVSILDAGDFL